VQRHPIDYFFFFYSGFFFFFFFCAGGGVDVNSVRVIVPLAMAARLVDGRKGKNNTNIFVV